MAAGDGPFHVAVGSDSFHKVPGSDLADEAGGTKKDQVVFHSTEARSAR